MAKESVKAICFERACARAFAPQHQVLAVSAGRPQSYISRDNKCRKYAEHVQARTISSLRAFGGCWEYGRGSNALNAVLKNVPDEAGDTCSVEISL
jgi:hypothetical protein